MIAINYLENLSTKLIPKKNKEESPIKMDKKYPILLNKCNRLNSIECKTAKINIMYKISSKIKKIRKPFNTTSITISQQTRLKRSLNNKNTKSNKNLNR